MTKRSLALLFAFAGGLHAASAPDSIAGTVYREIGGIASIRLAWQQTIVFGVTPWGPARAQARRTCILWRLVGG